jgi:uncharacterized protein (DUF2267 family)
MPETVNFAAQLPMLIRGFYYESWMPIDTPDKGTLPDQPSSILVAGPLIMA